MIDQTTDQLPPIAEHAEAATLGCMLMDSAVICDVIEIVGKSDFFHERNAIIFGTLVDLWEKNGRVDIVKLKETLKIQGLLEEIGGLDFLVELAGSAPYASDGPRYAKYVFDCGLRRKLIDAGGRIVESA
jgi:replicative DNA helicase